MLLAVAGTSATGGAREAPRSLVSRTAGPRGGPVQEFGVQPAVGQG